VLVFCEGANYVSQETGLCGSFGPRKCCRLRELEFTIIDGSVIQGCYKVDVNDCSDRDAG
jgi:hypothetical protein